MLCTRARAAGGGSLMNFNFLTPSSRPTETVGPLPSALQRWVDTPQSGQVEGWGGQRQFHRHLRQPAPAEGPLPAALLDGFHRRHQRRVIGGGLRHPLLDDQMVLTHRDGDGVPQRETPPVAQKAAVRIRQRGACASGFAQLLQPAGDLLQPLLERRDVLGRQLLAGSFVRIVAVALPLPAPNLLTNPGALGAQRFDRLHPVRRGVRGQAGGAYRPGPQPTHPQRARQPHHLREQIIQRPPVPTPKVVQRPEVRCRPSRQITEGQVLPPPLLQPPGRGDPQRIGVQPHLQHKRRVIRGAAVVRIALLERAQLQRLDRPMQKETDVVFAQHVPHARRQQIHLLRVVVQKFRHRASSRRSIEDVSNLVFTQTLQACRKSGHFNISTAASAAEARSSRGFHTDSLTPKLRHKNSGAITSVIVLSSLMSTCNDGPAVSLNGSPTVSPTTAALCASERLPPNWPVSMYFLALSQAPPPLFISVASRMPLMVPTIKTAATDSAPIVASPVARNLKMTPTATGTPTASRPGTTMAFRAPTVTMSTHRP